MGKGLLASLFLTLVMSTATIQEVAAEVNQTATKADDAADQAVELRRKAFQAFDFHFAIMADMISGKRDFNGLTFRENAEILSNIQDLPWLGFQAEGAHYIGDGDAKHDVWNESELFDIYVSEFKQASNELILYLKEDESFLKDVQGSFAKLDRTCQQCHTRFRD